MYSKQQELWLILSSVTLTIHLVIHCVGRLGFLMVLFCYDQMVRKQYRHTISAVLKCSSTVTDHLSLDQFLASHLWKFWLGWLQWEAFLKHVESLCLMAQTQHSDTPSNRSINKCIYGRLSFFFWLHQPVSSFARETWTLPCPPTTFFHAGGFPSLAKFSPLC